MTVSTPTKQTESVVSMGKALMARAGETLGSILGSCVGVVIYHPRLNVGTMAHVVLPDSAGREGPPGKYADVAIPYMINMLHEAGIPKSGLVAKIAGGSQMFGTKGRSHIGDGNIEAVIRILEQHNIRIIGKHLGGNAGRRVIWDSATGDLTVLVRDKPAEVI